MFSLRFVAWNVKVSGLSYDLRVLIGFVLVAVILGILNNMRVYEEQRVPWMGVNVASDAGAEDQ